MISPWVTLAPSKTLSNLVLASICTCSLPLPSVIISRRLPFVSLPNDTTPVCTASSALSFGSLASNKSATLGNPPVISLVPDVSRGVRAITSPIPTLLPAVRLTVEFEGR